MKKLYFLSVSKNILKSTRKSINFDITLFFFIKFKVAVKNKATNFIFEIKDTNSKVFQKCLNISSQNFFCIITYISLNS